LSLSLQWLLAAILDAQVFQRKRQDGYNTPPATAVAVAQLPIMLVIGSGWR